MRPIKTIPIILLALLLLLSGCGQKPDKEEEGSFAPANQETAIPIETVELDGFSIDYFKFGRGEKVFVILPGLSMQSVMNSAEAVANSYERLTEDCTIYVFDQRSNLPESYPVSEMAKDTAAAFKALGLKDIALFGASMGGMTAMEIAATEPELIEKLIVVSTCADVSGENAKILDEWEKLAVAKDIEGLYLSFGEALYPPETFESLKEPLLEAAKSVTEEEVARFIILLRGMRGFNITDKLKDIQCPVFALGDKTDGIFGPDAMQTIANYFGGNSGSEYYQYDGYGHAFYDLAPDFTERLLGFLNREEGTFSYEHDPRNNPEAMEDIVENSDAVYGFSPDSWSERLGPYADYDWTDPKFVAYVQKERREYHESMDSMTDILYRMREEGASTEEMARAVSKERNRLRIESYKDDPEGLAAVKESNLKAYGHEEGPTPDELYEQYGSWTKVMQMAFSSNMGMDACCGLYDEYYWLYIELGYVDE